MCDDDKKWDENCKAALDTCMGWGSKTLADKEDVNNEGAEHRGSVMGIKTKADKEDVDNEHFVANLPALTKCNSACQSKCFWNQYYCVWNGFLASECHDDYNDCLIKGAESICDLSCQRICSRNLYNCVWYGFLEPDCKDDYDSCLKNEGAELRGSVLNSIVADV